jgi:hypothetical protein
MRILLTHAQRSAVAIGWSEDGEFHVLWNGQSLGSAKTLKETLGLATHGPLVRVVDGTNVASLGVSKEPDDWLLAGPAIGRSGRSS